MLDNKLDSMNKPSFGNSQNNFGMAVQPANTQYNPAMQAEINAENIKQVATDNYISNRVNAFAEVDPIQQMGVAVPVWVAMNLAMDKYMKACRGEYSKSVSGKIGNLGDKITDFFLKNPVGEAANRKLGTVNKFAKKKIYDKSALVRAFNLTPSQPELTLVRHQFSGDLGMIANDVMSNVCSDFLKPIQSAKDLDALGASKADIERVKNLLKKATTANERTLILQTEELRLLGSNLSENTLRAFKYNAKPELRAKILKDLKIKAMGFKDAAQFELFKSDPIKYHNEIINALKNSKKNIFVKLWWSDKNVMSHLSGRIIGRKVHFSESANLLQASKGLANVKHTSKLGRGMAKLTNMVMEGATSRMAGGKFMAFMQAYFLAEALIMANKQETTGDKVKSLAERMTELIGFFVFMPPSIKLMHKIGGLQYSGMTPEQVEKYRQAVKEFNEKVMNRAFANKKEYKAARKALRAQFRPKTKNPFVWATRKCADIITVGLEQVRPYTRFKQKEVNLCITEILKNPLQYLKNIGPRLKDFACNPKYWLKQMAGYPVRFLLPMMVFITFFNKLAVKGCHMIFGKPKYSILDRDKIEKEQHEAEEKAKLMAASSSQATNQAQIMPAQGVTNTSSTNLLNKYTKPAQNSKPAQISHTGKLIPDKEKDSKQEPVKGKVTVNKYIPSPEGVKIIEKPNTEFDLALQNAEKAEKKALDVLAGKFT